eukprot:3240884-Prymnesium_polylepis.1
MKRAPSPSARRRRAGLQDFENVYKAMVNASGAGSRFRRRKSEPPPPLKPAPSQADLQAWLDVIGPNSVWADEVAVFLGLKAAAAASPPRLRPAASAQMHAVKRALQEAAGTTEEPTSEVLEQALLAAQATLQTHHRITNPNSKAKPEHEGGGA